MARPRVRGGFVGQAPADRKSRGRPRSIACWRAPRTATVGAPRRSSASRRSEPARVALSLVLAGLAFAADVGTFHVALTGAKIANAAFIGNVAPILAVIGGALIFAERPPAAVWPALALALFGSWIMAGMTAPGRISFGDAFALSAAVSFAAYRYCHIGAFYL